MRTGIAKLMFGIEEAKLRVITKDVGGGFGMKSFIYHEYHSSSSREKTRRR